MRFPHAPRSLPDAAQNSSTISSSYISPASPIGLVYMGLSSGTIEGAAPHVYLIGISSRSFCPSCCTGPTEGARAQTKGQHESKWLVPTHHDIHSDDIL